MQGKQPIVFTASVTEKDWDRELSGWRCSALKIPGAQVDALLISGSRADISWFEVNYELNIVRWVRSERPKQATLLIKLTEELSTRELTLKWKKLAIIFPLIASILVALIGGAFSLLSKNQTTTGSDTNPSRIITYDEDVRIIVPADNAAVPILVNVRGKYQSLPQEQNLYIIIYSTDIGKYYPQVRPVQIQPDQTWSCDVSIGLTQDTGKVFLIMAVLANKEAQNELNFYINRVQEVNDSPGIKDLPKGTQICSFVKVTRK